MRAVDLAHKGLDLHMRPSGHSVNGPANIAHRGDSIGIIQYRSHESISTCAGVLRCATPGSGASRPRAHNDGGELVRRCSMRLQLCGLCGDGSLGREFGCSHG